MFVFSHVEAFFEFRCAVSFELSFVFPVELWAVLFSSVCFLFGFFFANVLFTFLFYGAYAVLPNQLCVIIDGVYHSMLTFASKVNKHANQHDEDLEESN